MHFVEYIQGLQNILERIKRDQAAAICEAGGLVAESLARDGVVHIFGAGHSHMIAEEAFYRAGGLVAVNPILDERLLFLKGAQESTRTERKEGYARTLLARERIEPADVSIVISNSGRNAVPVEMAMEMNSRGIGVIAITNLSQSTKSTSRHSSGNRLFELARVVIDTCAADGDALLRLPGLDYPIGPSSTVAGAAIVNSIMIEAAAELLRRRQPVAVFPSANLETTTTGTLSQLLEPYHKRIRYLGEV